MGDPYKHMRFLTPLALSWALLHFSDTFRW